MEEMKRNLDAPDSDFEGQQAAIEARLKARAGKSPEQDQDGEAEALNAVTKKMIEIRKNDFAPVMNALNRGDYATVFETEHGRLANLSDVLPMLYVARTKETPRGASVQFNEPDIPGKTVESMAFQNFVSQDGTVEHFVGLIRILLRAGYERGDIEKALTSSDFMKAVGKGSVNSMAAESRTSAFFEEILSKSGQGVQAGLGRESSAPDVRQNLQQAIRKTLYS